MSRRIEIELTSAKGDATYTWRAAGARQPRGEVAAAVLPEGVAIGDTLRVEIETGLDGHEILAVIPERAPRKESDRLELIVRDVPDDALVTSQLATRSKGRRPSDRDAHGSGGRDGKGRRGPRGERTSDRTETTDRPQRERKPRDGSRPRTDRSGEQRADRPRPPRKRAPKAPRLRVGHAHRNAFLDTLADEQRPVAEKLTHGGMPNLRQAIETDNAKRREQGQPEVPADGLVRMAESILPRLQIAEWRDRADAALAQLDEAELSDLRSVVVAAADHAKTPEAREIAETLRVKLNERVERAHAEWLTELQSAVDQKRIGRLLNLSSHPPKAGAPLPQPLVDAMVAVTNEALGAESPSGRWVVLLDALAFSPISRYVEPSGVPSDVSDELRAKVAKLAKRLPAIASAFAPSAAAAPPSSLPVTTVPAGDGTQAP
ncbi:MAG: hypothetical protein JST73_03495 [Actinobacteria bacterium]|nr:hypothetical protein [Actinomycetota bacterium]